MASFPFLPPRLVGTVVVVGNIHLPHHHGARPGFAGPGTDDLRVWAFDPCRPRAPRRQWSDSVIPAALALALIGIATKICTGQFAAEREGASRNERMRADTALTARGEFSVVIAGLADASHPMLGSLVTAYVLLLVTIGPLATRWMRGRIMACW